MPELPEVQTTVTGLTRTIVGLKIVDFWSDYNKHNTAFLRKFKSAVVGSKVVSATRRAKNVLIHLDKGAGAKRGANAHVTILVHMKMTGHLLYGLYEFTSGRSGATNRKSLPIKDPWVPIEPEAMKDPYNRHVHFVISFSNGRQLALSDVRKFAKVALLDDTNFLESTHLKNIGPEPLEPTFTFDMFLERLVMRSRGKIKQVLMDQTIIAGIGNIYADETLWLAGIHPAERVEDLFVQSKNSTDRPRPCLAALFKAIKSLLTKGVRLGGDSMSDYRNVDGEKGSFQSQHSAYQKTGQKCSKKGCKGTIIRIKLGGRGTHFCDKHQKLSH
ncbi:MAG: bifunctional DNA-formamidopyrimidine glycosylase/DNA-(apurinic or apyrimidinic site) lyase [Candidatus Taylorbacteria bacterium]